MAVSHYEKASHMIAFNTNVCMRLRAHDIRSVHDIAPAAFDETSV
jgi:hypothetical protein